MALTEATLEEIMAVWCSWREPEPQHDEYEYTGPHTGWMCPHGWRSWNGMSPEQEFCDFAGILTRMIGATVVLETGVGQGYTTRRIFDALPPTGQYHGFESDDRLRGALRDLTRWSDLRRIDAGPTPGPDDYGQVDLTLLDSETPMRFDEMAAWRQAAPLGGLLLTHDCGTTHGPESMHRQIRAEIESLDIAGRFLANPRGGFLGVQT